MVFLQILKAVFDDEPVRLTCVGSGKDAQRVLEEQGCDLLITDKNLPDINGLELLQQAKEVNPFSEVIIITGYASLETALAAMEYDAFDYVVKPLNNVFDIRKKIGTPKLSFSLNEYTPERGCKRLFFYIFL